MALMAPQMVCPFLTPFFPFPSVPSPFLSCLWLLLMHQGPQRHAERGNVFDLLYSACGSGEQALARTPGVEERPGPALALEAEEAGVAYTSIWLSFLWGEIRTWQGEWAVLRPQEASGKPLAPVLPQTPNSPPPPFQPQGAGTQGGEPNLPGGNFVGGSPLQEVPRRFFLVSFPIPGGARQLGQASTVPRCQPTCLLPALGYHPPGAHGPRPGQ